MNNSDWNCKFLNEQLNSDFHSKFRSELMSFNRTLLQYPQRVFEFKFLNSQSSLTSAKWVQDTDIITIYIDQNMGDVGSTVWDAEVVLAHYLETVLNNSDHQSSSLESSILPFLNSYHSKTIFTQNIRVLELGAGTGVAGIMLAKYLQLVKESEAATATASSTSGQSSCSNVSVSASSFHSASTSIVLQELDDRISHLQQCVDGNAIPASICQVVAGEWGPSFIHLVTSGGQHPFDVVMMADVLYYAEDFQVLKQTCLDCLRIGGQLIISVEQRRKNLSDYLESFCSHFEQHACFRFDIEADPDPEDDDVQSRVTRFYLIVYSNRKP